MNVTVSGLHLEKSPDLHKYAQKKTAKLAKIDSTITDIKVRLLSEKSHRGQEQDFYCELTVHVPGKVLEIVDVERDMPKAIDKAVTRMQNALKRHKEKVLSKKHKQGLAAKFLSRFRK